MKQVAIIILVAITMLVACGDSRKHYLVGVSQCSNDPWRDKFNDELQLCTFLYDNYALEFRLAEDSDQQQVEQIDELIDMGVDLIIVAPNKVKTITPAINRAYKKGIPVILFDRKADTQNYTATIGADNEEIGYHMARYLAFQMDGKGRVVEIEGLEGSSAAIERHKGFCKEMGKYPGIKIVGTLHGDWKEASARKAMDKFLENGTHFDAVFAHNDRMAIGARSAVEAKGVTDSILYIGIDALPGKSGGMELVLQGKLDGSYVYPTRGYAVAQLASDILEGRPFKRENKLTGTHVTIYNVKALQLQREEIYKQRAQLYDLHSRVNEYLAQYKHQQVYTILALIIVAILLVSLVVTYKLISAKRRLAEQDAEKKLKNVTNTFHKLIAQELATSVEPTIESDKSAQQQVDDESMIVEDESVIVEVKPGNANSQFIRDFNKCVLKNMGDSSFSVDTLSRELGLSRAQAYRKIKALTGFSPAELIRKTRLKRADQLLKSGGRSVTEVLYEVGFTSSSYFAKCFKEEFGRLPSD